MKKSTEQTSRSKAMQVCVQWQRAADMARQRTLTEQRAREVISEIITNVHGGEGLPSFTVREWFEHFSKIKADSQESKTATNTIRSRRSFWIFSARKADLKFCQSAAQTHALFVIITRKAV